MRPRTEQKHTKDLATAAVRDLVEEACERVDIADVEDIANKESCGARRTLSTTLALCQILGLSTDLSGKQDVVIYTGGG